MSGSGGYYKYRCKYWLTYNCPNWVWVNNATCAHCLASWPSLFWALSNYYLQADGRDSEASKASPFRISREVCVPQFEHGFLHYIMMEIVANSDVDSGWVVKLQPAETTFPTSTTMPVSGSYKAFSGVDTHGFARNSFQQPPRHVMTDGKEGKLEGH